MWHIDPLHFQYYKVKHSITHRSRPRGGIAGFLIFNSVRPESGVCYVLPSPLPPSLSLYFLLHLAFFLFVTCMKPTFSHPPSPPHLSLSIPQNNRFIETRLMTVLAVLAILSYKNIWSPFNNNALEHSNYEHSDMIRSIRNTRQTCFFESIITKSYSRRTRFAKMDSIASLL